MTQKWGSRRDKDNQLVVPLVDKKNWKRVRFLLLDHFTGFRYGDDAHSVNVVLVQDIAPSVDERASHDPPKPPDAGLCLTRAEEWAKPQLDLYGVNVQGVSTTYVKWRKKEVPVRFADAHFEYLFEEHDVSAAWASYPAYPDACLIFGIVVSWNGHPELARQVRDRWIREGVPKLRPRSKTRPVRR
jgi:hypothetical protein